MQNTQEKYLYNNRLFLIFIVYLQQKYITDIPVAYVIRCSVNDICGLLISHYIIYNKP